MRANGLRWRVTWHDERTYSRVRVCAGQATITVDILRVAAPVPILRASLDKRIWMGGSA
jgi:hypothetical protein